LDSKPQFPWLFSAAILTHVMPPLGQALFAGENG
jgi:hypothetical protein